MNLDGHLIRDSRQARGWTQQHLAEAAALSLRTVQRVENQNMGSHETVAALCSVLELERKQLLEPQKKQDRATQRQWLWLLALLGAMAVGMLIGALGTVAFLN